MHPRRRCLFLVPLSLISTRTFLSDEITDGFVIELKRPRLVCLNWYFFKKLYWLVSRLRPFWNSISHTLHQETVVKITLDIFCSKEKEHWHCYNICTAIVTIIVLIDLQVYSACSSVCKAVGVADRNIIPDARMTASTTHSADLPYYGRLNGKRYNGVWCTKTRQIDEDYLQVDMGAVHSVCAVATQGPRNEIYTTSYKLQLSTDGVTWSFYKENNVEKVIK